MEWMPQQCRDMLQHPKPVRQFKSDIEAMGTLVLPYDRSAHTAARWFAGQGRTTIAYILEKKSQN